MTRSGSLLTFMLACALVVSATAAGTTNKVPCQLYTVVQGDFSSKIATAFGVELKDLMAVNPEVTSPDSLAIGQELRIPPWDSKCVGDAVKAITGPGQVTTTPIVAATMTPAVPKPEPATTTPAPTVTDTAATTAPTVPGTATTTTTVPTESVVTSTPTSTPSNPTPIDTTTPTTHVVPVVTTAPGAVDLGPSSGVDMTMTLVGRLSLAYQTDLKEPFLSELARALGVEQSALTLIDAVPVTPAVRRRRLLQTVPEKPVVKVTVRGASPDPEGLAANATAVLTPGSAFDTQVLPLYQLSLQGPATVAMFKDGQSYDPAATVVTPVSPPTPEAQPAPPTPTPAPTTPAHATPVAAPASSGGSSLSTGAIVCISIGSVAFVAAAVLAAVVVRRRRRSAATMNSNPTFVTESLETKPSVGQKVDLEAVA